MLVVGRVAVCWGQEMADAFRINVSVKSEFPPLVDGPFDPQMASVAGCAMIQFFVSPSSVLFSPTG